MNEFAQETQGPVTHSDNAQMQESALEQEKISKEEKSIQKEEEQTVESSLTQMPLVGGLGVQKDKISLPGELQKVGGLGNKEKVNEKKDSEKKNKPFIQINKKTGKVIFTPILINGKPKIVVEIVDFETTAIEAKVQYGFIWTNEGRPLEVKKIIQYKVPITKKVKSNQTQAKRDKNGNYIGEEPIYVDKIIGYKWSKDIPRDFKANCWGHVLADNNYFIDDGQGVNVAMKDDYFVWKPKGVAMEGIPIQKGDVLFIGIDHLMEATGDKNSKGEDIWESHFRGYPTERGSLDEIIKGLPEDISYGNLKDIKKNMILYRAKWNSKAGRANGEGKVAVSKLYRDKRFKNVEFQKK